MNRPEPKPQPTVEEMLTSIRQAIHGANVPDLSGGLSPRRRTEPKSVSPPRQRPRRESTLEDVRRKLDDLDPLSRNGARSTAATGFAGILSGNVQLDEALAKLKKAGLGDETSIREIDDVDDPHEQDNAFEFADDDDFADMARLDDDIDGYRALEPDRFSEETRARYLEPEAVIEQRPIEAPQPKMPPVAPPPRREDEGLTSDATAKAASAAFNKLAETIVSRASSGERSIDDITRELLRPMLQAWLDENLPELVERLVREEISRVARSGPERR